MAIGGISTAGPGANTHQVEGANRRGPNFSAMKCIADPAIKLFKGIGGVIQRAAASISNLPSMLRAQERPESFTLRLVNEERNGQYPSGLPAPDAKRPTSFTGMETLPRTGELDRLENGSEVSETSSEEIERVLAPTDQARIAKNHIPNKSDTLAQGEINRLMDSDNPF